MTGPRVIEFQPGRSRPRNGAIIGALCTLVGLAILLFAGEEVPDRHWVGGLMLVLGPGIALHAWRRGRPGGVHLRIDGEGVYFRDWGLTVPWREIEDVYQTGSRLQPFVALKIRSPQGLLAALGDDDARALRRNPLWRDPELRIPFSAVEASRDELLGAIESGLKG